MASTLSHQAKRIARGLSRRLRDFGEVEPEGFDLDAVPSAQIALYFADGLPKLYQLTQWLPVFEEQRDLRTIVVVRQVEVEGFLARVEIDVTEPARVVAIITREAVEELGLEPGVAATAIVKSTSVMVER